jgi:hypothetical protein
MIILLLTFVTLFLAIFFPCLVVLHISEKNKQLGARMKLQRGPAEAEGDAAWRRSKQMILG